MLKRKKKDNDFEKSKKEFLEYMKVNHAQSSSAVVYDVKTYDSKGFNANAYAYDNNQQDYRGLNVDDSNNKSAWEYELQQHRRAKTLSKIHTFGAICGMLSLAIVLLLEYETLLGIIFKK